MTRARLAVARHAAKETAVRFEPDPLSHRLHPHLEEARDWLTGSLDMSKAAAPREDWGSAPLREDDLQR
eukprot:7219267-Pyramimonas_sp.AAC.1